MWQDDYDNNPSTTGDTIENLNWTQAVGYCNGLTDLGHSDWRLPNVNELVSITDDADGTPPAINSAFEHTQSNWYWSSTTYATATTVAWGVHFSHGNVGADYKSHTHYVRCVRGFVVPLNTSPIARDDSFSTSEDTAVSGNVITKATADSDPESDPLHVSVWGTPANGTLSATDSEGNFTYTPNSNWNGTDTFQYTLSDDGGLEDNATVQITVGAVNDIPVITEGTATSVTMSEDSNPTAFALTLNATDGDGDVITWSIETNASNGTATATGTGTSKAIAYTPAANYNGADNFVVEVTDGNGVDSIDVNVTITPVNDAPTPTDNSYSTTGGQAVSGNAITDAPADSDREGDALHVSVWGTPTNGILTVKNTNGAFTYSPTGTFTGTDTFQYTLSDDGALEDNATVTITVGAALVPDINVKASDGSSLADGTTTVSVAQGTDFGSIGVSGGAVTHTFTLENTGTAPLESTISCSDTQNYALQELTSPLTGTTTFQIAFNPSDSGTYDANISISNNVTGSKNPYTFAIRGVGTGDSDGVEEPSGVDGNDDGIDDSEQHDVATITTGSTQTTISTTPTSGSALTSISSSGGSSINATLSDGSEIVLPYGTVSFTVTGLSNGGTAHIELFYPYDESIIGYAKQFADGTWHDVAAVVTHSAPDYTKVTFDIVDGSEFDLDGLTNGEVKDPGGAYRAASVTVPLSPLAKAIIALLFALGALFFMRRKIVAQLWLLFYM